MGTIGTFDPKTKVLIVEDQPSMKKIMVSMLRQFGLEQIDTADSGADALEMLRQNSYDVVLSDWRMPEIDGLSLLKSVREDQLLQKTPFILISGDTNPEKVKDAISAGVSNYIVKPISANVLRQKLQQTIRRPVTVS